jgi:hypothetical protein
MEQGFLKIYTGLLAALLAFPLQAAVYQWTDENGRVHFSDRPTHDSAQQKAMPKSVTPPRSDSIPVERQQRRQRMLEVYEAERAEKREAAAKAKEEKEERKRKCLNARVDYENYSSAGAIYDYQESGERKYLDKQQRNAYISKLKARVEKYCK